VRRRFTASRGVVVQPAGEQLDLEAVVEQYKGALLPLLVFVLAVRHVRRLPTSRRAAELAHPGVATRPTQALDRRRC
jgi:hypothetical protein